MATSSASCWGETRACPALEGGDGVLAAGDRDRGTPAPPSPAKERARGVAASYPRRREKQGEEKCPAAYFLGVAHHRIVSAAGLWYCWGRGGRRVSGKP